ncbi:hypothetical protein [Lacinutrix sp. MEBiC02595]
MKTNYLDETVFFVVKNFLSFRFQKKEGGFLFLDGLQFYRCYSNQNKSFRLSVFSNGNPSSPKKKETVFSYLKLNYKKI